MRWNQTLKTRKTWKTQKNGVLNFFYFFKLPMFDSNSPHLDWMALMLGHIFTRGEIQYEPPRRLVTPWDFLFSTRFTNQIKVEAGQIHGWRNCDALNQFKTMLSLLPTAKEGNVFISVCHSVHDQPHAYSVTAHPCWLLGHCYITVGSHATGMLSCLQEWVNTANFHYCRLSSTLVAELRIFDKDFTRITELHVNLSHICKS